jgi:hypothetical protein
MATPLPVGRIYTQRVAEDDEPATVARPRFDIPGPWPYDRVRHERRLSSAFSVELSIKLLARDMAVWFPAIRFGDIVKL